MLSAGSGRSSWWNLNRTGVLGRVGPVAVRAADRKGRGPRRAPELDLVQTLGARGAWGKGARLWGQRLLSPVQHHRPHHTHSATERRGPAPTRRRTPVRMIDDAAGCPDADTAAGDRLFLLAFYYITKGDKKSIKKFGVLCNLSAKITICAFLHPLPVHT